MASHGWEESLQACRAAVKEEGYVPAASNLAATLNIDLDAARARGTLKRKLFSSLSGGNDLSSLLEEEGPVIFADGCEAWPAVKGWSPEKLAERCHGVEFSIGDEGGDSSEVRIPVDHYFEYAVSKEAALEDNPLYLFETLSVDREQSPPRGAAAAAVDGDGGDRRVVARSGLLSDYTPSRLFSDDLFSVASSPPQYRTNIHQDPFGTSAWNTSIVGHKRWVLFHPNTPQDWICLPDGDPRAESCGAAGWFAFVYPRVMKEIASPDWKAEWQPVECVQGPGETVVVPTGWWHVVLNLDLTVAVTQNFAELRNLPIVRRSVFRTLWIGDLLHESDKWLAAVSEKWPGLVDPSHCVECGTATDTVLPLLSNRRLCSGCEQVGPAYALFSAADATKCYKLGLDKLMTLPHVVKPAAGEDNAPPVPYFLQQHVLELAEAVYGKDTESSGQYVDQRSFGGSALIVLKA
eukprot:gene2526-9419_t